MGIEELEGIARAAHERADAGPMNALALARKHGVALMEYPGAQPFADLVGRTIYLPARPMRRTRRQGHCAHELGHILLRDHGHDPQNETAARYLAGALLVPREDLDRQLRRSWSLRALRACHVNASNEMLARRVTQLRSAVATVIDGGKVTTRVASPWLHGRPPPIRVRDLALAARALEEGEAIDEGPMVAKYAGTDRVVLVVAVDGT